jgi:hypothetical protein
MACCHSLLLGTVALLPLRAHALEWSCGDMKRFVDSMYEAATYLANKPGFDENPEIEKGLDTLLPILQKIADDEQIASFSGSLAKTRRVWAKEEWAGDDINEFRRSFDATTTGLERIYEKYCD